MTPRVRIDVMDAEDIDYQRYRPENEFPLARTDYRKLFLDSPGSLSYEQAPRRSSVSYDAQTGSAAFDFHFDEETEITGYLKLRLWVEAQGSNDMDLFIAIQKLDGAGKFLPTRVLGEPYPGTPGLMRVSHREIDPERSTPDHPYHTHRAEQLLTPGEVVPVEIEIYPTSRIWHAGEQLRVLVSGHYHREGWFEPFSWETRNQGTHVIHFGGDYDSHLLIPVIPPKLTSGDYRLR